MSAMLVSFDTMDRAVAAVALATAHVSGVLLRDEWGAVSPSGAAELGRLIFDLNGRSVGSRYEGRVHVAPNLGSDYSFQGKRIYTTLSGRPPHDARVALFKSLTFVIYQCHEDATEADPLLAELKDAQSALARELVTELPAYNAAPWG